MRKAWAILALVLCAQCDSATAPQVGEDEMRGDWAGEPWVGAASTTLVKTNGAADTLYIFGGRPKGTWNNVTDVVRIRVVFSGVGSYAIGHSEATFTQFLGGDVIVATYAATVDPEGQLTITEYSASDGVIKGTFNFHATSTDEFRGYGPSARFEDGRFHASVGVVQR